MGNADNVDHGIDGTECVGDMIDSYDAGLRGEKSLVGLKVKDTLVAERNET